jgi:hypothetical protein
MTAFRRDVSALTVGLLVGLPACNHQRAVAESPRATLPPPTLQAPWALPPPGGNGIHAGVGAAPTRTMEASDYSIQGAELYSRQGTTTNVSGLLASSGPTPPAAPTLPPSSGSSSTQPTGPVRREMREREARLAVDVDDVTRADERFVSLVRAHHGDIEQDEASLGGRENVATVVARVPDEDLDALLDQAGGIGLVVARDVKMRDVGKEYFDAQLLEQNLVEEIRRAEELLGKATSINDIMTIDQRLAELRTRLDQVRGQLVYMKDHVERAVVSARFASTHPEDEVVPRPDIKFFPNVRGSMAFDWRSQGGTYGYAGGGVSFTFPSFFGAQISRGFSIDLDVLTYAVDDRPQNNPTAFVLTMGTDSYSDFLGGGRRRFLDPFVGWRIGYAQTQGTSDVALGLVLGVDLFKSAAVLVPLRVEALGMAGNPAGPHAALVPSLGVSVAF